MAQCLIGWCLSLVVVRLADYPEGEIEKNEVSKPVCETWPKSCKDPSSSEPRIVAVMSNGLEVICDTQTDGGVWTVFQRRVTGALPFYRAWEEYKYGFGDVSVGEFYIGNENIHQLTSNRRVEIRIDFTLKDASYCAKYSSFRVYCEPESYRLKVSDFTGDAGDSLMVSNDMKFSMNDRDQDFYV